MAGTSAPDMTLVAADPSAFFLAFAAALQRQTAYPEGHPLLQQAVERVSDHVDDLLAGRDAIVIGVTPERLLIDDVPVAQDSSVVRELARRLHRRDVGAIRMMRGVEADELDALLRAIARRDERDTQDETTIANTRQVALPHVQLFPLQFAGLTIAEPELTDADAGPADSGLWERLVHLAVGDTTAGAGEHTSEQLASNLRERLREPLFEAECARDIAELLAGAAVAAGASTRGRVGAAIAALEADDLRRLLAAQPDGAARRRLVMHGARALPAAGLLALTKAAGDADNLATTGATMVLLEKLATIAAAPSGRARGRADAALRRHIEDMVTTANAGGAALAVDRDPAASLAPFLVADEWARPAAPLLSWAERLVRIGLEIDSPAPPVLAAVESLAAHDEPALVALADGANAGSVVGARVRARAFTESALTSLLASGGEDEAALAQVAHALGPHVVPILASAMFDASRRIDGVRIGRVLCSFGDIARQEVAGRLHGASRQSLRIIFAFFTHAGTPPGGCVLTRYIRHPDAGVRSGAARLLFTLPDTRDAAAREALQSEDAHLLRLAARHFIARGTPADAVAGLVRIIGSADMPSAARALAVRAVQGSREPIVCDTLLDVASTRARLTRRARLAPLTPHVIASLHALARGWSEDSRVREVLDLALEIGALSPIRRSSTGRGPSSAVVASTAGPL